MRAPRPPPPAVQTWLMRASVALFVLTAIGIAVVMVRAGGGYEDASLTYQGLNITVGLLFVVWNAAPPAAGVWVAVLARGTWPHGSGAVTVGAVVVAAFTVVVLRDFVTSDSSTAALIFLFLPFWLWLAVGAAVGAAALLQVVRGRRARRDLQPG